MIKIVTASQNRNLDLLLELICGSHTTDGYAVWRHRTALPRGHRVARKAGQSGSATGSHHLPARLSEPGHRGKTPAQTEFDLDLVCQLSIHAECHPGEVYRLLWDRMAANDRYKKIMEPLPRCIRLNYASDFHLDIVPAVPDLDAGETCILVPDLNANLAIDAVENDAWKPSNPKGFQAWFEDHCKYSLALNEQYVRAHVEPLPDKEEVHEKHALKRSVQLFKRWRDKEFQDRPKLAPPSIILTTLSGHLYRESVGAWTPWAPS